MTPTIRIDHDVYEALRNAAEPFVDTPNSVLRRLLQLDDTQADQILAAEDEAAETLGARGRRGRGRGPRTGDTRTGERGRGRPRRERGPHGRGGFNGNRMQYFFEAGLLKPGDKLIWERRNNDECHTATVDAQGHFHLEDGEVFETPSGAARHLAGYDVSGWRVWARESDRTSLRDLARQSRESGESGRQRGESGDAHRGRRRNQEATRDD